MCFRPSAVSINDNTQRGTCPTCGMPVAADPGTQSGTCPYCGEPIPLSGPEGAERIQDPTNNTRIL